MDETVSASLFIFQNFFRFVTTLSLFPLAICQRKVSFNRNAYFLHISLLLFQFVLVAHLALKHIYYGLTGIFFSIVGQRLCVPVITGGIGAGKSTLGHYFASNGFLVIDSDSINRQLMVPGTFAYESLIHKFGLGIVLPSGEIDRAALREIVFNDDAKRKMLNRCLHKYIIYQIIWEVFRHRILSWNDRIVIEVPLLYDTPLSWICGPIIVCVASVDTRVSRCQTRNADLSRNIILNIIKSQPTNEKLIAWGDFVIENESSIEEYHKRAQELLDFL
ncbi:dephospho-CoA kinase, putative [Theileria equi strain WA]|uniref:Dephospho-CoA kinase, putative n=1 Tax=Theileria equi strain WA TaxID=1537102 RepID=L1LF53_THEEQ|nr:dephospho-CoA kinase, putative [Theileria equi strain WA]EKX73870.1 dephospho-CoA kinase, putative [Theileria equi strain WA]|eukprot:XP_004833322.1 dephospho-CoA kinase, putative [Theileria equi strain WA]